jgi:predicted HTH transcriptional regulator
MPDFGVNDLDEVLQHPRETLHIELKDWFDPRNSEGIAKLVKACFAIYNRDGGMLFIGFDNTTGKPSPCNIDPKALEGFHADVIQAALSKYASRPFSVDVLSHSVAGHHYPIIKVPSGV